MKNKYPSIMDLHTHTVASGHAYNSIREMAKAASEKGLEVLGITEHGPKMPGSCHRIYFQNYGVVPRELYGVQLLMGAEVNILDADGNIDLYETELTRLDLVIASIHVPCMKPGSVKENTMAYVNAMRNPYVNIIGHPDDSRYEMDYKTIVEAAKEYGKVLEVNNHSLCPTTFRQNARENYAIMLELCKEYKVPVVMNTDAHFDTQIGEFDNARNMLEQVNFPEELVVNHSVEMLKGHVHRNLNL